MVDKTTANDVDYYKDIKCNNRKEREDRLEKADIAPRE